MLGVLALAKTTRRTAQVLLFLARVSGETDSPPSAAGFIRRTVTAGIPDLLAEAARAGMPAH